MYGEIAALDKPMFALTEVDQRIIYSSSLTNLVSWSYRINYETENVPEKF